MFLIEDPAGRRPVIRGRIDMGSTRISGRFVIRNATIDARPGTPAGQPSTAGPSAPAPRSMRARLSVGAEVMFAGRCEVTGGIDMSMGDMSSLSIGEDCVLRAPGRTALDLTNAEIRAVLRLDEDASSTARSGWPARSLHGTLALHGTLSQPEQLSLVDGSAMTVDGDVYLDGLRADRRHGSTSAAPRSAASGRAGRAAGQPGRVLDPPQPGRGQGARSGWPTASPRPGWSRLNRTTIEGRLQFTGGSFSCPAPTPRNEHGHAIEAMSATVRGGIDLGWQAVIAERGLHRRDHDVPGRRPERPGPSASRSRA